MSGLDNLSMKVPIVGPGGAPTKEFMIKWQQLKTAAHQIIPLNTAAEVSAVLDLITSTAGDMLYRGPTSWQQLPIGAVDDVLTSAGGFPEWHAPGGSTMLSPLMDAQFGNAEGDMLFRGASSWGALPIGSIGQVLGISGSDPAWVGIGSALDVLGNVQGDILIRSGSGWTVLPAGTSGEVLTTAGAGHDPLWGASGGGGGGNSPPTLVTFSTVANGSGVSQLATYNAGEALTVQRTDSGPGGDHAAFRGTAVPGSAPWTVRMQVRMNNLNSPYGRVGMGIYDSISGKVAWLGPNPQSGSPALVLFYFTNLDTFSGAPFAKNLVASMPWPEWYKVDFSGADYTFSYSWDNAGWYQAAVLSTSGYMTATNIGVVIEQFNSIDVLGASVINYLVP